MFVDTYCRCLLSMLSSMSSFGLQNYFFFLKSPRKRRFLCKKDTKSSFFTFFYQKIGKKFGSMK